MIFVAGSSAGRLRPWEADRRLDRCRAWCCNGVGVALTLRGLIILLVRASFSTLCFSTTATAGSFWRPSPPFPSLCSSSSPSTLSPPSFCNSSPCVSPCSSCWPCVVSELSTEVSLDAERGRAGNGGAWDGFRHLPQSATRKPLQLWSRDSAQPSRSQSSCTRESQSPRKKTSRAFSELKRKPPRSSCHSPAGSKFTSTLGQAAGAIRISWLKGATANEVPITISKSQRGKSSRRPS